jgi:exopolysaccharide production protein ExoZ
MGVDVFFVISGVIISRVSARSTPGRFFVQRLTRVLPLYFIILSLHLIDHARQGTLDPLTTLASVSLWPAYGQYVQPYVMVAWTLSFEILFYVCVGLTLAGVRARTLLAAYAACFLLALWTRAPVFTFLGSPFILEFLFGVGLAFVSTRHPLFGLAALAVAALAIGFFALHDFPPLGPELGAAVVAPRILYWGVPAAALVYAALQLERYFVGPLARALAFLGDASYSLYLTHMLTVAALGPAFGVWPAAVICVLVSVAVYLAVERPLTRFLRSGSAPSQVEGGMEARA